MPRHEKVAEFPQHPGLTARKSHRPEGVFYYAYFQTAGKTFDGWIYIGGQRVAARGKRVPEEVIEWLQSKRREFRSAGEYVDGMSQLDRDMQLHAVMVREVARAKQRENATVEDAAARAVRLEAFFGSAQDVRIITREQWREYISWRRNVPTRVPTHNTIWRDLKFCKWAIAHVHDDLEVPCSPVRLPPRGDYPVEEKHLGMSAKVRTDAEVNAFLSELPKEWLSLVLFALQTGLRAHEIGRLEKADVRLQPYPHVLVRRKTSGKKKLPISLGKLAQSILNEAVAARPFGALMDDEQLRRTAFRRAARAAHAKNADLFPDWRTLPIHLRDLRATFGRGVFDREDKDIEAVRTALGHTTIEMSQEYIDVREQQAHIRQAGTADALAQKWKVRRDNG